MQSAVNPNPVAAILDTVRVSFPAAKARSFTCPVVGSACSQKKRNPAFSISSSNWSSVPGYPSPTGGGGDVDELPPPQPNGKIAIVGSDENTAALLSSIRKPRLVTSIFKAQFP